MTTADSVENDTRKAAEQIIAKYQLTAPVRVGDVAKELGLNVWVMPSMPSTDSGKIFLDLRHGGSSGFSIGINPRESVTRKRFTVAHEIAHFILHRDRLTSEFTENTMYRSSNPNFGSGQEREANALAADILMPKHLIRNLKASGVHTSTEMARRLGVSQAAMNLRLGLLGISL
jgi:hypothetical protein